MLSGLLNRYVEFEYKNEITGDFGNVSSKWVFYKRTKATVTINTVDSYTENRGEYVNYITTFIIRYDKNINYTYRLKFRDNYYKIRAITEMGRRDGLIIKAELIEGNNNE